MKKIFVSYSHQNQEWVLPGEKYDLISWLSRQLKRNDVVVWTDHALKQLPGEEYNKLITREIEEADMAIMLISQDFVASEYIMEKEVPLIRSRCESGQIKIMPLLLSRISNDDKKRFSWIFDYQIYPSETIPLIKMARDLAEWEEAKVEILDGIRNRLKDNVKKENIQKPSSDVKPEIDKTGLEKEQLKKEREELERLRQRVAEQQKIEEERKKLQTEREQLEKLLAEKRKAAAEEEEKKRQAEEQARKELEKKGPQVFTVNGVSFEMVPVEGGTFWMGAQSEDKNGKNYDKDANDDESPIHQVTLSNYSIGKYPVTQELWKVVMGSNPSYYSGTNLPVENVGWNDCQKFINKLNQLTGKNFRLPTEAEWEYAVRGGNKSNGYKYSGSNTIKNVAWYDGNSSDETHPVGTKQPNELGIYDMSGNVWEWCQDRYGSYSSGSQTNPTEANRGSRRVLRGGSWDSSAGFCRVSFRFINAPGYRIIHYGFRLVLVQ